MNKNFELNKKKKKCEISSYDVTTRIMTPQLEL